MKRKILAVLIATTALASIFNLTACHSHTFEENWSYDVYYHWQNSTCNHGYASKRGEHVFEDRVCKICDMAFISGNIDYIEITDENEDIIGYRVYRTVNAVCLDGFISIPDNFNGVPVTEIGQDAFYGYSGNKTITEILLPSTIKTIGRRAFCDCTALKAINIPNSVTSIGYSAFTGCESLEKIFIPVTVTEMDTNVFYECSSLTMITYGGTMEQWKELVGNDISYDGIKIRCSDGLI